MASRFVRPDTATLRISQGDTLLVKRRLNAGEQRASYARMYLTGVDGTLRVNPLQTGLALITAYLVDWSLTGDDGRVVPIRDQPIEAVAAALDALEPASFTEIKEAIEAHEVTMAAERSEEKKQTAGANASSATSPLPSGSAGATNGSPSSMPTSTTSSSTN